MKCCKTCKWAKWQMTNTGKISRIYSGECVYRIVLPVMPECVMEPIHVRRGGIWPDLKSGANCLTYEAKSP